jgi:hypothetical protein
MAFDLEADPVSTDLLVLQRARYRVARGWCQDYWHNEAGDVCIVAAIVDAKRAVLQDKTICYAHPEMALLGEGTGSVWNDTPGRTQAEVLQRFDEAIARLSPPSISSGSAGAPPDTFQAPAHSELEPDD